jgi:hypothetical protein
MVLSLTGYKLSIANERIVDENIDKTEDEILELLDFEPSERVQIRYRVRKILTYHRIKQHKLNNPKKKQLPPVELERKKVEEVVDPEFLDKEQEESAALVNRLLGEYKASGGKIEDKIEDKDEEPEDTEPEGIIFLLNSKLEMHAKLAKLHQEENLLLLEMMKVTEKYANKLEERLMNRMAAIKH